MSLINKMLQDLDARGTPAGESFPSNVTPVAPARRGPGRRAVAVAVAGACAAGALAWYGWGQLQGQGGARAVAPAAPVAAATPAPGQAAPGQGMRSTITLVQNEAPVPVPVPKAAPAEAVAPGPAGGAGAGTDASIDAGAAGHTAGAQAVFRPAPAAPERRAETTRQAVRGDAGVPARSQARPAAPRTAGAAAPQARSYTPAEPGSEEARAMRSAMLHELQARRAGAAPRAGRQETGAQRAEGEYRRALASLQEGRMIETVASLEQALRIDPTHEAARQTLVGLLIEAGRTDEAMRQLQLSLTQDARQPALAMLLARLQIERGGSGIETLTRTLPYAGNNPDYHAFLAGALQRQQRHREAALEYQAALRGKPDKGVWWMGLGISLQAEKRNGEALDAFQKARAAAGLSPDLQAFVERKVQQLGH